MHRHPLELMHLDAEPEGDTREPNDAEGRPVGLGLARLHVDGQPDLVRALGRQAMEAERRQQAHDAVRDTRRGFDESVVLGRLCLRGNVEPAPNALELALLHEAPERRA